MIKSSSHTRDLVFRIFYFQVDPEVFAALPPDVQEELKTAYDQRHRQGEITNNTGVFQVQSLIIQISH